MRVFVLALTVAFVAGSQVSLAPQFEPGKTYEYQYEAVVMGGLPEKGLARAGVKVRSKVQIGAEAQTFILKLVQPEIFEYSGIWPNDSFSSDPKLTSTLAAQLKTPVKFEYTNGVVGKVFAPASMTTTVLNVYRGILSILQLNIKKTQNVYELQEASVHGICKTHYALREEQEIDRIFLIKSKDLNQCQSKIYKDISLDHAENCVECQARGSALKTAAVSNYLMKPTPSGSLIMNATVEELIQFSPFNILKGAAQMESKQTLTFLDNKNVQMQTPQVEYPQRGDLQYEFGSELLQTPIQLLKISNVKAQMKEILEHLVTMNAPKVSENAPLKFIEFIQLLRMAKQENIQQLWEQLHNKPEYKYWILSAVSVMGTHTSLKFIKEKFFVNQLSLSETASALLSALLSVSVDLESVEVVKEIMMSPTIQNTTAVREIVMLGYGALVGRYYAKNPAVQLNQDITQFIYNLATEAVSTKNYADLTLALKVLGNIGYPGSLKAIQKNIPSFSKAAGDLPLRIQIEAVLALRNIAKREPKQVQERVLQVFMDHSLDPELRIAAAVVLFESKPPLGLVNMIAASLLKESNLQVTSFVYSYMKAMTKTTVPDFVSVAAASNVAMKMLSPKLDRLSYRYSRMFYYDTYYSPWMMGAAASAYYINEAATIFPRAIMAKTRNYLAGISADVFEFGVRTEGIQEALLKGKNIPANADRITKIKQVVAALQNWKKHPSSKPLASMYVKFLGQEIAFLNVDRAIYQQIIEHASIADIQGSVRSALNALREGYTMNWNFYKPMLAAEIRRILPTSTGFPMELSFYTAAVAAASLKVSVSTTGPVQPQTLMQLLDTNIRATAEIAPSVSMHTYAVMGVNTAYFQASLLSRARVHTVLPSKIEAILEMSKGNYKIQLPSVQDIYKIASASVETFALVRNVEDLAAAKSTPVLPADAAARRSRPSSRISRMASSLAGGMSASSEIIPDDVLRRISRKQKPFKPYEKKMCAESETFGFKACTKVESYSAAFLRDSPLYGIIGNHTALIKVKPVQGPAIERIEFEVQVGEKAAEKIIKVINQREEEETLEDKNVLLKLKKILVPGPRNNTAKSSSSSSSSRSSSSSKSRSSSISSSDSTSFSVSSQSSSSRSVSRPRSGAVDVRHPVPNSKKSSSSSSRRSSRRSSSSSSGASSSQSLLQSSSRSSSSSSSSSSALSKQEVYLLKFKRNHVHQHRVSANRQHSHSSATSFENIQSKAKYLSDVVQPSVTILLRAVRVDHKPQGYQVTAYLDKATSRLQIILANLVEGDKWRICTDAMKLSSHKLMAATTWGIKCKQYATQVTAESGLVDQMPAIRFKLAWDRIPRRIQHYAQKVYKYISRIPLETQVSKAKVQKERQISLTVAADSEKSLYVALNTEKRTYYKHKVALPFCLPFGETAAELEAYQSNFVDLMSYMYTKGNTADCTMISDTLRSFNNRKFINEMPHACSQVLAYDATEEHKFMVELKRSSPEEQYQITVTISNIDINMYLKDAALKVNINGADIPISDRPYVDSTGTIQIRQKRENRIQGISLIAPKHGLQEVFFGYNTFKIKVVDWMRKVSGVCGIPDGETRQEYRKPNGQRTKDPVNHAHHWVVPGKSCRDVSECFVERQSVKLEKQVNLHGQQSKCYSVEPVLRCLAGCTTLRTTAVNVGFHCVPADSNINQGLSNISEKSIDLIETAEAHLACRCAPQCA
ncbi:vitellogenin-2-like isoform X1 [Amphiprion ocellaris]|uniref:vitellogenin-2-like isoform X1 n=1 Tax=Amphiprion ocellaris TaxID=80972 RepID=UPI002411264C|nr:vitellogenin-2-like isoform X1 [Amphiprion ocellaris]